MGNDNTNGCATCAHCNLDEARPASSTAMKDTPAMAGLCTKRFGYFSGRFVPVWLRGCPDYTAAPVADVEAVAAIFEAQ